MGASVSDDGHDAPPTCAPEASRTAKGTPLITVLPIERGEAIASVLAVRTEAFDAEAEATQFLVLMTRGSFVKKTPLAAFASISR